MTTDPTILILLTLGVAVVLVIVLVRETERTIKHKAIEPCRASNGEINLLRSDVDWLIAKVDMMELRHTIEFNERRMKR